MTQNPSATVIHSRARVNPHYKRALETSPQFVAATKLRAKLRQMETQLPAAPVVAAPTSVDEVTGWLDAVAAADAATRARAIQSDAIRDSLIWCDRVVEDVATADTDQHLSCLDDALTQVMGRVAKIVDALGGAVDPRSAINAGTAEVWKTLEPLRAQYDAIRTAQSWVMAGEPESFAAIQRAYAGDETVCDLTVADFDTLRPRDTPIVNFADGSQPDLRPWPADDIELLIWLCTNAMVWVPTIAELRALARRRQAEANQPPELVSASTTPTRIR